ncbi:MacS family sensor histidine kinase [Gordonia sp. 852002-51296_SCH5728562-b]|uniref:MacS family sensor histidine kinase n=1 Tax=Gordonia sp. 852002-51296_SCH5728562-b TaxID=1834101 RepID=UPI0007EB753B|nr:ATP-binding protein [Gordonia sp. 852002-51296_SCH5728562-b]OBA42008.1 ATP-binding protein [Gordonia sp. 852002-51296_SCH5728562-b]
MRSDPVTPLWRGAQVLRLLSYLYALGFRIAIDGDLLHPGVTWVLFGFLTVWTVACGIAYYVGFGRNWYWVGAELVIACALMLSTSYVASESWALNNQTWPTTLWATNSVISAALLAGPIVGLIAGLVVGGTSAFVKGWLDLNFGRNATIIVMMAAGVAVGLAAVNARRAQAELAAAARVAAAASERERLSREVHDGVLQVLSFISKRGREIGGATAQLADLAATQEVALRRLIADVDVGAESDCGTADLTALLRAAGGEAVAVSAPADPVEIDATTAREISAAVINALDNVAHHAGPGARAYVLLEDLGDAVVVSVRDDGVGIAAGRLDEARRQGRLGVAQSIVGRIESLGGRALLDSDEGIGTEWELTVPVTREKR